MKTKIEMLRAKMEKFNQWEAKTRRALTESERLEQFLTLYDLGQLYGEEVIRRAHENHLADLIKTSERLNKIAPRFKH